MSFLSGFGISVVSVWVYLYIHKRHVDRISDFPQQALVVVVKATVIRFFITGVLLIWIFTKTDLSATTVLLGFVSGQVLFLINQLRMVAKNDVK